MNWRRAGPGGGGGIRVLSCVSLHVAVVVTCREAADSVG